MKRKAVTMPKPVPIISEMTFLSTETVGYSVHLVTDAGEMDVTVTDREYFAIRDQLTSNGRAVMPTSAAAA